LRLEPLHSGPRRTRARGDAARPRCERAAELAHQVAGAQLVATRPLALTDGANAASWRCDYRNTSPSSTIEIVAEAYCVRPRE
jgi:hypothetical protein